MASTARLDELKKKFDENPRRYFAPLANELRKSGDVEQAIALCRTHLPQQPAHISGHIVLGQALFEGGHLDESRDTFHAALELDPENLIALRYLGDIARSGGDVPTARSWYQRVLEVDPRNDEIGDLIRDLDAPPAEQASKSEAEAAALAAPAAAQVAQPVSDGATAAPPADESRFAPLSLDEIDADTELFAPSGQQPGSATEATPPSEANAVWTSEAPTAEMPVLDVPELDPFDMPASATADSLFDTRAASAADHGAFFLDDLTPNDPVDVGELEAAPAEPTGLWSAERRDADSAPPAAEAPAAPEAAVPQFEEGAFYVEPPPVAPDWSGSTHADSPASSGELPTDGVNAAASPPSDPHALLDEPASWEELAPSASLPAVPNVEAAHEVGQVDAAFEQGTAATFDAPIGQGSTVDEPAAPPAATADDGLGLEVMEFVPPTSGSTPPLPPSSFVADPLAGHTPELTTPEMRARPDAFVTETMAELYLQQGFRNEALAVYHELLARNPGDTSLRDRIDQIESGSMSSLGMATLSENVVESARRRQTERPSRSVRSFFASLAGRRAPHAPSREVDIAAYEAQITEPSTTAESSGRADDASVTPSAEPQPMSGGDAPSAHLPPEPAPTPVEAPRSAAEQMASFDPFADAWDAAPVPPNTPNDAGPAPSGPKSSARSLEDLFPESSPTPRADAAAQTLATAFGRPEPQGRPTRAASNELSLDRVFRGAPESAPANDGGFSFDQFFSDAPRASGPDASAAIAATPAEGSASDESGDTHDIEQFTAWLEGLKKK